MLSGENAHWHYKRGAQELVSNCILRMCMHG